MNVIVRVFGSRCGPNLLIAEVSGADIASTIA
jgi:hypothetical protein